MRVEYWSTTKGNSNLWLHTVTQCIDQYMYSISKEVLVTES